MIVIQLPLIQCSNRPAVSRNTSEKIVIQVTPSSQISRNSPTITLKQPTMKPEIQEIKKINTSSLLQLRKEIEWIQYLAQIKNMQTSLQRNTKKFKMMD